MRPFFALISLTSLFFIFVSCERNKNTSIDSNLLAKEWIELLEHRVFFEAKFQPKSLPYDASKGFRRVFKFGNDGSLNITFLGNDLKPRTELGAWRIVSDDILELNYDNGFRSDFVQRFQVLKISESELLLLVL